ncbi:hypothetical protein EUGRSUZ_A02148 [Eucalyptus grandis]|uniref:peroxidase n=2 Tax=Eucalyptus grandis TaxID=71139 RepID=A0A059DHT5_EUCGR|nr:hypothetical protein EUGRSUZ_A02148 [Eucalyptus grandis]
MHPLIDSIARKPSEKFTRPNFSVRRYDIIDEAKKIFKATCLSTVPYANMVMLATQDSVLLVGLLAGVPSYNVPMRRRDGLVSYPNEVNLPRATFSISEATQAFMTKGFFTFTVTGTLLDAHSVGAAHCSFLVTKLKGICRNSTSNDPTAFLDQSTSFMADNSFACAMVRLGNIQVPTGNAKEIRRNCRIFNKPK